MPCLILLLFWGKDVTARNRDSPSPPRGAFPRLAAVSPHLAAQHLPRDEIPFRGWVWGSAAAVVITLSALWIDALRRSLARVKAAEARERDLNATLEERVLQRTAELEAARVDLDIALGQERELNQLKTRFVATVSHEFRTPLGVTMSALELLRHHRDRLSAEKQGELLDDIFSATLRMSALMEQILLLGQAESGKMRRRLAPLDLPALCRRLATESLAACTRTNPVDFHFSGELSPVLLDESLLRLILGNLLTNAIKYSPPDGTVTIRANREEDGVVITIADQGIGIPPDDQGRLFEAFYRAANVGETSGSGLGLLLVKRCTEIHGGVVNFDSAVGGGTTFQVSLPLES